MIFASTTRQASNHKFIHSQSIHIQHSTYSIEIEKKKKNPSLTTISAVFFKTMSARGRRRPRDSLDSELNGVKWLPTTSSVNLTTERTPPQSDGVAVVGGVLLRARVLTSSSPVSPESIVPSPESKKARRIADSRHVHDEDKDDDDDDDHAVVNAVDCVLPVVADRATALELERRSLELETKNLDGPAWQMTSSVRSAKRLAMQRTSVLASTIGSEPAPRTNAHNDDSESSSSTASSSSSSSSSSSGPVIVSTIKPKRLRVRAANGDDDDDDDENDGDNNDSDKENADSYSNAMITALTSVGVATSDADPIRPLSTRDRLEQLAARKRQDEQRRKESNYLTNLTEAELPSFSSSFIVDDLGTGVLHDSQLDDELPPPPPPPPPPEESQPVPLATKRVARRRRRTAAPRNGADVPAAAAPTVFVDVWTQASVERWPAALRRAWRDRAVDPDAFLMRHIDLELQGDGWCRAARGAWSFDERLALTNRVHELRDKRVRFANSWGLLSKALLGRTGADAKLQFEQLMRAGVIRHREFEIDDSGAVQETIEVEDACDDRSLRDVANENCLSEQWHTAAGRALAAQIDAWLGADGGGGNDDDLDNYFFAADDDGDDDDEIATLMTKVHGARWRWADDVDANLEDVPLAHRMPSALMDDEEASAHARATRPPQQRSLVAMLHGPTHSATTSTSLSLGRRALPIPRLPVRHAAGAARPSSPSAGAGGALDSESQPPLLIGAIRSDLSLVYLPSGAHFWFGVDRATADEAQRLFAELTATHIGVFAKTRVCVRHLIDAVARLALDDGNEAAAVAAVHVVSACVARCWPSVLDDELRVQLVDLMRELLLTLPGTGAGMQLGAATTALLRAHCLVHSAAVEWLAPLESASSSGGSFSLAVYADWLVRACVECGEARPEHLDLRRAAGPSAAPLPLLALWLAVMRAFTKPTSPALFWPLVLAQLRELPGAGTELHVRERAWTLLFVLLSLDQFDASSAASRALTSQWAFVHETLVARALRQSASADGLAFFATRDAAAAAPESERRAAQQHYVDVLVHRCMQLAALWPPQDALGGSSLLRVWAAFALHFALAEPPFVDVSEFVCTRASWRAVLPPLCDAPLRFVTLAPFDFCAERVAAAVSRPWERVALLWVGAVCVHCPELVAAEEQRRRVIADHIAVSDSDERWSAVRARDGPQCVKLVSRAAAELARARLAHQHPLALANAAAIVCVLAGLLPAADWAGSLLWAGRREPLATLLAFDAPLPSSGAGDELALAVAAKHVAVRVCELLCAHLQATGSADGVRYLARLYRRFGAHLLAQLDALRRRVAALNAERVALRAAAKQQFVQQHQLLRQQQHAAAARQSVKVIGGGAPTPALADDGATRASEARIDAELAQVAQHEVAATELLSHVVQSALVCLSRMRADAPLGELALVADDGDGGGAQLLAVLTHSRPDLQAAGVALMEAALTAADSLRDAPAALAPFVAALDSGGVVESLAMLVRGVIGRLSNQPRGGDDADVEALRRAVRLLMRTRHLATDAAVGERVPLKSAHWFAHTNNWLPMSEATAAARQVSCSWPVRVALLSAACELARDAAFVRTHTAPLTGLWLRAVLEWPGGATFDAAQLVALTRAIVAAAPELPRAFAEASDAELCDAVDFARGAPLVAALLTRWVSVPELRGVQSIWLALAPTLDAIWRSQRTPPSVAHVWTHIASAAALLLRCERGAMPADVRAALLSYWTRATGGVAGSTSLSAPSEFYTPLGDAGAAGLSAVLQSFACAELGGAQAVLWQRVALACVGEPSADERRRRRLLLCDADELLFGAVARAVRLSAAPSDWPAATYAPFVSGDRQLQHRAADAVCQAVANWLACPVATAAGRNQWIGFQRVMLALARALISPISSPTRPELSRWAADSFATYRLTVAVAQLSRMCSPSEPATLQLATRCLYFFGLAVHYAVELLGASAPTDRIALLPFWRVVVRLAGATALCMVRDVLAVVARELQHTFDIDWYLERDKHSSAQLAAVAEAAISASASIGASSSFVVNTRVSALPPIELPRNKHWHAETSFDDPLECVPYVTGMFAEFGRLQDDRVATTLSELAVDLERLAEDAAAHLAPNVVARLTSAARAAANGAAKARGFGIDE
jgi:hypothetical protein